MLRRLNSFSLPEITTPSRPEAVSNDPVVRKLAILSQLAVFKDIIPGYRIRALTDKEKEEKVSQMVARTREWEQGLVNVYQQYLKTLESELKGTRIEVSRIYPLTVNYSEGWARRCRPSLHVYTVDRRDTLQLPRQYHELRRRPP